MLRYIYKARNIPPPYLVRTDTLIKALPLSQGLASHQAVSSQRGVCFKLGLPAASSALLLCAPVTLPFSQALAFLLPVSCHEAHVDRGFHPVGFTLRRCQLHLWRGQMAAGTNPTPCLEMRDFNLKNIDGGRGSGVGNLFDPSDSEKQKPVEAFASVSNINEH